MRGASTRPVTVLTGFLGSGKTTLLRHLLADPATHDTAVLVNEFGDVALDHHFIREVRENLIVLESGCICCSIRNDLVRALCELHVKAQRGEIPRFSRVILETTGLADPTPIVGTIAKNGLVRSCFHLASVVTAVDGCLGLRTLSREPESIKQAALADELLVTKTDVADVATIEQLERRLRELNPLAPITRAERGVAPRDVLLRRAPDHVEHLDAQEAERGGHPHEPHADHDHAHAGEAHLDAFSETIAEPLAYPKFALWLSMMTQFHGEHLLRVKGILHVTDDPLPVVVQSVQHVVYPVVSLSAWPFEPKASRLVVITRGLDPSMVAPIRTSLRALAGDEASRSGRSPCT
jgi:G3E family GTPase